MTLLDRPRVNLYANTWREQLVICVSGFLGILATNLLGPRISLLFGSATGTLHSLAILVAAYQLQGWFPLFVVARVLDDIGKTVTRVCLVTLTLAYPREQKKARVLALFQFVVDMFLTLGQVLKQNHGAQKGRDKEGAMGVAWARLLFTLLSSLCIFGVAPIGSVIRDSGVYVLARQTNSLRREFAKLTKVFRNKYMLLLMPYMFSYPFALGVLGISFPNRQSVLFYNIGSLLAVAVAFVLDIGLKERRRRGQLGFAIITFVTLVCMISVTVLNTRYVDPNQLQIFENMRGAPVNVYRLVHYRQLFYATVFLNGMSISSVFLFSGWVIGSLTNDAEYSARFTGALLSVPALGTLTALLCLGADETIPNVPANSPLYVGIALLTLSFVAMYYVVHSISDTNNWSLSSIRNSTRGISNTVAVEHCCVVDYSDRFSISQSSIAKLPLPQ
ncbi:hypothetical protein COEREDRAFT_98592 [Coemansia reversa NRRL 1564]|uniref:Uncharacterized protein n=1 Tax=Coemansia reversa (strain ATCC 12441 / NRRL 1564) TaxID=763665 RepID=A0A2G5B782_COERN|nr:hypothetical protein COEREDRAFT_98592 [Coemansia reversa NRRL 1564]|eukprot:PIA14844.1 hypothetical protein COEREDRAFT_98592 [Coemansia reversa NRRL 1564]